MGVLGLANPDIDAAGIGLLGPDDKHIGNMVRVGAGDLGADLVIPEVRLGTDVGLAQAIKHIAGIIARLFADRQDANLLGSEPEREIAGVLLDEDTHEALQ